MSGWTRITYRDFYDVPRLFIIRYRGMQLLFDCEFDKSIDDYSDTYKVYLLPDISDDQLRGSWELLSKKSTQFLGVLPVTEVIFDSSLRGEVETKVIDALLGHAPNPVAMLDLNGDDAHRHGKRLPQR